jgi:hypothetical protein
MAALEVELTKLGRGIPQQGEEEIRKQCHIVDISLD